MGPRSLLERSVMPFRGVSAGLFASLSRMRGHRVFHPYGEAFDAKITFNRRAVRWLPDVIVTPRSHPAIVRFSRGLGLPDVLPDVYGMAIKIPGLYGGGGWDQDWLMVTSGTDVLGRHLLIPTLDLFGRPYSTVLPYRQRRGSLVTFGARSKGLHKARSVSDLRRLVDLGGVEFDFTAAPERGDHVVIGTITLIDVMAASDETLRYNPWNTSSELPPVGALNELRRDTYRASQRARRQT